MTLHGTNTFSGIILHRQKSFVCPGKSLLAHNGTGKACWQYRIGEAGFVGTVKLALSVALAEISKVTPSPPSDRLRSRNQLDSSFPKATNCYWTTPNRGIFDLVGEIPRQPNGDVGIRTQGETLSARNDTTMPGLGKSCVCQDPAGHYSFTKRKPVFGCGSQTFVSGGQLYTPFPCRVQVPLVEWKIPSSGSHFLAGQLVPRSWPAYMLTMTDL
uniref:Uncharacterized protein n=1 Tax=Cannabis sativa TaxID=3483 RepID=A0A803PLA2_CANSA